MKNFNKRMAAREGFTLVELIVVIAILAILAAVAYPAYTGYIAKANDAAALSQLASVLTASEAVAAGKSTQVKKIEVNATDGTVSGITVTCTDDSSFSADVGSDFLSLLGVSEIGEINLNSSSNYKDGATWLATQTDKREAGWTPGIDAKPEVN